MPGGVCAVLDYDVELMAEYVAEMATRVVTPRSNVSAAFRKFVSQILTSTRLPSTTILLGMNYLAKRVNLMTAAGQTNTSEGHVWRMLTVALLLGSKFLDDNTFQNKSWSEVSGLPVRELNTMEFEWLRAINWVLYVNLDESKDYNAWLKNWQDWLDNKKRQQARAGRERLASLVTPMESEAARLRSPTQSAWYQQQVAEYNRLSSVKRSAPGSVQPFAADRSWHHAYPTAWHAPLTPPDSGYGTPEYAGSAASASVPYHEWFDRAIVNNAGAQRQYQHAQSSFQTYHHASHAMRPPGNATGYYDYHHSLWDATTGDCNCASCSATAHNKNQPYFASHSYGQPVMG